MTTLSIGKTLHSIGVSTHHNAAAGAERQPGILSRFASAAYVWAEKYGEYKYNQTDWKAFRF